jgi:hypothetical protein
MVVFFSDFKEVVISVVETFLDAATFLAAAAFLAASFLAASFLAAAFSSAILSACNS